MDELLVGIWAFIRMPQAVDFAWGIAINYLVGM